MGELQGQLESCVLTDGAWRAKGLEFLTSKDSAEHFSFDGSGWHGAITTSPLQRGATVSIGNDKTTAVWQQHCKMELKTKSSGILRARELLGEISVSPTIRGG